MKSLLLLSAIITSFLFFAGCKMKDNSTATTCKLSSFLNTGSDTTSFTYDPQNRVTNCINSSYADYAISYSGLTAIANITTSDTSYHGHYNLFLNGNGTLASMNNTNTVGSSTYNYTYAFTYDAAGHIVLCDQSFHETGTITTEFHKDSLVYVNGNLTAKYTFVRTDSNPYALTDYVEITYTGDLNKAGWYIWGYDAEPTSVLTGFTAFFHLYGTASKNLPANINYFDATGTLVYKVAYSFMLSENGFPAEENMVRTMVYPYSKNRKFTYSCN